MLPGEGTPQQQGLEFLPHAEVQNKLKNMVQAVKKFN